MDFSFGLGLLASAGFSFVDSSSGEFKRGPIEGAGLRMEKIPIPSVKMGSSGFFSPKSMMRAMVSYLPGVGATGARWFCHRQSRRVGKVPG